MRNLLSILILLVVVGPAAAEEDTRIGLLFVDWCAHLPENVMIQGSPPQAERTLSLFELTLQAKDLGYRLVPITEMDHWTAGYPIDGAPVKWFNWRFDLMVPAGEIPPDFAGGFKTAIMTYVLAVHRDSMKVQLRSIGATGTASGWTDWTFYDGSHRAPKVEVER
jgi:hypothetical protein